jgi:Flp pilus assembly protein TadG
MRRLTRLLRRERGATAVLFALLLVPMIAAAAIAVDVGALYAERAQLQNGADAAALAVAADCADLGGCGSSAAIAGQFADENAVDGAATTLEPTFPTSHTVTVTALTQLPDGSDALPHPFARVLGFDPTTVVAEATAEFGSPSAGSVIPLALAYCEFTDVPIGVRTLIQYDTNKPCKGPTGQPIDGGFGWLDQLPGQCEAYVDLDSPWVGSDPGLDPPNNCATLFANLENTRILIPVYKGANDVNGQHGEFEIYAFASFLVTGWKFTGNGNSIMNNPDPLAPACTGGCRGIQGYFSEWVEVGGDWETGGVNLGVNVVTLIK